MHDQISPRADNHICSPDTRYAETQLDLLLYCVFPEVRGFSKCSTEYVVNLQQFTTIS